MTAEINVYAKKHLARKRTRLKQLWSGGLKSQKFYSQCGLYQQP